MTLKFNGAEIPATANIQCNGKTVQQIHFNAQKIWERQADPTLTPGASVMGGIVDADGLGIVWNVPGTYTFVPPVGVTSICAVAVGAGKNGTPSTSGAGGNLRWSNDISVTAAGLQIVVAAANAQSSVAGALDTSLAVGAGGGQGGGNGGTGRATDSRNSGGGAGGYTGNGGRGGGRTSSGTLYQGAAGTGGAGGGGGAWSSGGGGVGLYGEGASGDVTSGTGVIGHGGSGGSDGASATTSAWNVAQVVGGRYGGGGSNNDTGTIYKTAGTGAVRIMWTKSGVTRSFPTAAALVP